MWYTRVQAGGRRAWGMLTDRCPFMIFARNDYNLHVCDETIIWTGRTPRTWKCLSGETVFMGLAGCSVVIADSGDIQHIIR